MNMKKQYQSPELDYYKLDYDVLTSSDNDAGFGNEDGDDFAWGQYY